MERTLQRLDHEWQRLVGSPEARDALARWGAEFPALAGARDLDALLRRRRDRNEAPAVLSALAALAASDVVAARTLLQALLPGLYCLASSAAADDPTAVEEMVSIAWVRIRTYPPTRRGSVAANVLWDVRKGYRRHHRGDDEPRGLQPGGPKGGPVAPSAEEIALTSLVFEEQLGQIEREGVVSAEMLRLITRTRVGGATLVEVAAESECSVDSLNHRRLRAERDLRRHLAMAS